MSELLIAPAKVNYYLAVTGKREDGFHALESLVFPTRFGDVLHVSIADEDQLTCSDSEIPCGPENLILKAVDAYRRHTGFGEKVRIHLEKHIPSGAGLGGGSSDAATILQWLNEQNSSPVSSEQLEAISAEVGSDCPLFLRRKPIVMKGRGELLSEIQPRILEALIGKRLVLFKPHFSISTVWAYQSLAKEEAYHASAMMYDADGLLDRLPECFNSFEVTMFHKYPVYMVLKNALHKAKLPSFLLSGSGSACFAFVDEKDVVLYEEIVGSVLGTNCFYTVTDLLI